MSEKAPTSVKAKEEKPPLSRSEMFEAGRAKLVAEQEAEKRQAFEASLYGEAAISDFSETDSVDYSKYDEYVSDEKNAGREPSSREDYAAMPENQRNARRRIDEAIGYQAHLERMASPDYVSTSLGDAVWVDNSAANDPEKPLKRVYPSVNIDNVPNEAFDRAVAEGYESAETGMDVPPEDPEMDDSGPHFHERQLATKLLNPELKGTDKLRDGANKMALKTVNAVEAVAHKGQDARAFVKNHRLEASHDRAKRKQDYLEYRAQHSFFAFRSRRFASRAEAQKKVVAERKQKHEAHKGAVDQRHKRHEQAVAGRGKAYEARYRDLLNVRQLALLEKAERRRKRLGRFERLPVKAETKRRLEQKRTILDRAIEGLMAP